MKAGRLLIRVLNLVEMRFRCQILGGWWCTSHNEDADGLTRLDREEAVELMQRKGRTQVKKKEDTGPCFGPGPTMRIEKKSRCGFDPVMLQS